jgi:hypothetical protein
VKIDKNSEHRWHWPLVLHMYMCNKFQAVFLFRRMLSGRWGQRFNVDIQMPDSQNVKNYWYCPKQLISFDSCLQGFAIAIKSQVWVGQVKRLIRYVYILMSMIWMSTFWRSVIWMQAKECRAKSLQQGDQMSLKKHDIFWQH